MSIEKLEEEINYVFTEEKGRTALLVQLEIARQLKRLADLFEFRSLNDIYIEG